MNSVILEQINGSDKSRVSSLDLLRIIAASSVMLFHYSFRGKYNGYAHISCPSISWIFCYGYLGVNLFFMVSGYVIAMTAEKRDAIGFAISRISRLYPGFWICCTVTYIICHFFGNEAMHVSLKSFFFNLTMIPPFLSSPFVDGVYWTLIIEMRFYGMIFLILALGIWRKYEIILWPWIALCFVSIIYDLGKIGTLLSYGQYFIAGSVYYLIYNNGITIKRQIMLILSFILSLITSYGDMIKLADSFNTTFHFPVIEAILYLMYIIFYLIAIRRFVVKSKIIFLVGASTYPLYLLHEYIGYILLDRISEIFPAEIKILFVSLTFIIVSTILYYYIEKKLVNGLRKYLEIFTIKISKIIIYRT